MHASGKVTIITPTTGKLSLDALIESIERQTLAKAAFHLLLWDDVRDAAAPAPERRPLGWCSPMTMCGGTKTICVALYRSVGHAMGDDAPDHMVA